MHQNEYLWSKGLRHFAQSVTNGHQMAVSLEMQCMLFQFRNALGSTHGQYPYRLLSDFILPLHYRLVTEWSPFDLSCHLLAKPITSDCSLHDLKWESSQWLGKNVARSTGKKDLKESIDRCTGYHDN